MTYTQMHLTLKGTHCDEMKLPSSAIIEIRHVTLDYVIVPSAEICRPILSPVVAEWNDSPRLYIYRRRKFISPRIFIDEVSSLREYFFMFGGDWNSFVAIDYVRRNVNITKIERYEYSRQNPRAVDKNVG